jgi:hypothetical protein
MGTFSGVYTLIDALNSLCRLPLHLALFVCVSGTLVPIMNRLRPRFAHRVV